jgi:cytochrome c-type biogenesis protein CcmH
MARFFTAVFLLIASFTNSFAVEPDELMKDPAMEARARVISAELRCLVCQNQSIDDSDAALAKDLRLLVRERLRAGDSNKETIDYIVARYGEFVLLRPRFLPHTYILWFTPPILLLLAIFIARRSYRVRHREADVAEAAKPLSDGEQKKLDKLLSQ